jgi:hypothetical protein
MVEMCEFEPRLPHMQLEIDNILLKHYHEFPQDGKMFSEAKDAWLRKLHFLGSDRCRFICDL